MTLACTDVGAGPVIVLLHAFPVNRHLFDDAAGLLAAAGWRVIAPDLPGFGESAPLPGAPDLAAVAVAVLDTLDDLGVGRFVLGGVSLGGYVAMAILRRAPERVAGLLLLDTKMTADAPPAREQRFATAARALREPDSAFLAQAMLPTLLSPVSHAARPQVVAQVDEWIRSTPAATVAWIQEAMARRPDSTAVLAGYDGPALVLAGADDEISPVAEQEAMAATLPHAELVVVADTGHLSVVEAPAAVAGAIAERLR